ncbi:hypothetical protein Tco_1355161 [Tanacetum coccineum]
MDILAVGIVLAAQIKLATLAAMPYIYSKHSEFESYGCLWVACFRGTTRVWLGDLVGGRWIFWAVKDEDDSKDCASPSIYENGNFNDEKYVELIRIHAAKAKKGLRKVLMEGKDIGGIESDVSGSGVSNMQDSELLLRSVASKKRIVYTTTRPNDIKTLYEKMLESDVEFGAPDKRSGGFLNSALVSAFVL